MKVVLTLLDKRKLANARAKLRVEVFDKIQIDPGTPEQLPHYFSVDKDSLAKLYSECPTNTLVRPISHYF